MTMLTKKLDANQYNLKDQVVSINRVTKVVKGGKNMSFAALVVVGDAASGVVGYGSGKAKEVGKVVAEQAVAKGIKQVVFDRGGYLYHGRVKALADAAREAGLEF